MLVKGVGSGLVFGVRDDIARSLIRSGAAVEHVPESTPTRRRRKSTKPEEVDDDGGSVRDAE